MSAEGHLRERDLSSFKALCTDRGRLCVKPLRPAHCRLHGGYLRHAAHVLDDRDDVARPAAGYSSSRGKVWEERHAPTKALTLQPGDRTHICRAGATAQLRAVSPWEADALPSHWTLAPSLALWAG